MSRRNIPRLEELGARVLPSMTTVLPAPPAPPAHAASIQHTVHHALAGKGNGTWSTSPMMPDVGTVYQLQGSANLADLGQVRVSGKVHSLGFIAQGHAGGQLIFTNSYGSVTIELVGPIQPGFSQLPTKFDYHVVSGTKAYAHLSDKGSLTLELKTNPVITMIYPMIYTGTFKLNLDPVSTH